MEKIKSEYIAENFYANGTEVDGTHIRSMCSICKTKVIAYYRRKEIICPVCMIRLIEEQHKEKIQKLQKWIYKNNTIPFKDMFTNKRFKEALENEEDKDVKEAVEYSLSNMRLATTDGGWVNVIELNKKIKEIFG